MNTTIYFTRHTSTNPLDSVNVIKVSDNFQISNEKAIAGVEGEKLAKKLSKLEELSNIDVLYSSNYARSLSVAKYISFERNIPINIDEDLGERKFGIESLNEITSDFGKRQFDDPNYKIKNGESRKMVQERMTKCINRILDNNRGKNISVITHSTALIFYLMQYIDVKFEDTIYFNNKKICDFAIPNCGTIAVTYNFKNEIVKVKPINYEVQPVIEGNIKDIRTNLLNNGFKEIHHAKVIANYYLKKGTIVDDTSKLKNYCIRIRKFIKDKYIDTFAIENYFKIKELYKINSTEKETSIKDEEALNIEKILLNNNYELVYTDEKNDNVFIKDNLVFQIQDLKGIGLTNAALKLDSIDISENIEKYLYDKMDEYGIKYKERKSVNRFNLEKNTKLKIKDIITKLKH